MVVKGFIEEFMTMDPKVVRLKGAPGEKVAASIKLIPKEKYPFKILKTRAKSGDYINYALADVDRDNKTEYILNVENTKAEAGNYTDYIYLETDSKVKPQIRIRVYGTIINKQG